MSTGRRIVIDCDPGIDDAVALLLATAHPDLDLLAVTCVSGNKPVDITTANARRVLDLAGRSDVPVHRGADRPLLNPAKPDRDFYGRDGLGDIGLPAPSRQPDAAFAADAIVDTVMSAPAGAISLCAIGPLTNIALAMRKERRLAGNLAELVVMGGNLDPGADAEFNISTDPAAAQIVLSSEAPLTLVPYNVTREVHAGAHTLDALAASSKATASAAAAMLRFREPEGSALHDVCALAFIIAPDLLEARTGTVEVEWRAPAREGMTLATDPGDRHRIVTGADVAAFERLLISSLA